MVEEALTNSYERKEAKGKGEKERYMNESSKEQQGEIRRSSSVINAKK